MKSYQESKERERQVVMAAEQVRWAEERELQIVATREIEKFRERVSFVIRQVCTLLWDILFTIKFYYDLNLQHIILHFLLF